jgi:hypothetical protein
VRQRLDGLAQLATLCEKLRGVVHLDRYDLAGACVQLLGDVAVLSFNFLSQSGLREDRWNCTEVYRRDEAGAWRIIHTHWSKTGILAGPGSLRAFVPPPFARWS